MTNSCLVVTAGTPTVAKTFGASPINDGATTTLVFTLTNSGSNPAQSGISLGDTLPTGLLLNSATPAVSYSAGCSGPATAVYTAGTRVLSGLTGIAMTATTASCTVTVAGVTNAATQTNASCVGNPAAFTNLSANVTTSNATNTSTDQCLVVNRVVPAVAKTFGAVSIADGGDDDAHLHAHEHGDEPGAVGDQRGRHAAHGADDQFSATPALTYSAGCSGPANAAYNGGTRVLSGVTGLAMASGTVSCTVTVAGLTNAATQMNASCVGNPAAFTNLTASVTTAGATNASDGPVPGGDGGHADGSQELRGGGDQRRGDDDAHLHAHEHGDEPGALGDQPGRHAAHGACDQQRDAGGDVLGGVLGAGERGLQRRARGCSRGSPASR